MTVGTRRFAFIVAYILCVSTSAWAESDENGGTGDEAESEDVQRADVDDDHSRRATFEWLPGACCLTPHALSASRDTAGFAIPITPYSVISEALGSPSPPWTWAGAECRSNADGSVLARRGEV